jgi:hypothetical protein
MLKVGIVGLPNVGKSTLFKILTKNQVDINNYPFCTIDPNVGIVEVKDERVDHLSEISQSKKKIPAIIEFVDIAGLVKGAHKGEGLGNKFLSNIRNVDLICHVVRFFLSSNIKHIEENVNPKRDADIINTELILADLATVKNRIEKTKKIARSNNKQALQELETLNKIEEVLNENKPARDCKLEAEEQNFVKELQLITTKPVLYVLNVKEEKESNHEKLNDDQLLKELKPNLKLNIKQEEDSLELPEEEIKELNIESHLDKLPKKAYDILNLITFLTTGEEETRAWTVEKGATAPEAGSKIHNDFKEKFIRAEVIHYDDFIKSQSWKKAKELGQVRTEGKDYIVKDGDIIIFKI